MAGRSSHKRPGNLELRSTLKHLLSSLGDAPKRVQSLLKSFYLNDAVKETHS